MLILMEGQDATPHLGPFLRLDLTLVPAHRAAKVSADEGRSTSLCPKGSCHLHCDRDLATFSAGRSFREVQGDE